MTLYVDEVNPTGRDDSTYPLACPACKNELTADLPHLRCRNCRKMYRVVDGVFDFLGDDDIYWGEIGRTEMAEITSHAEIHGWMEGLNVVSSRHPSMRSYLLSPSRTDWVFHCMSKKHTQRCLDIGSGWGTNSFNLLNYFDEVWSLEAVRERLGFQRIRQKQTETRRIHFVRSDWLELPFSDDSFDLVAANGVLEWVGLSRTSMNPRDVQTMFLREVHRILKPGGSLYVGIENRYGAQFLLGARDHSGLAYTSIVPRPIAGMIVRMLRDSVSPDAKRSDASWRDYRTYTYTKWGYSNLLSLAGFSQTDVYWTMDYNNPVYSGRFSRDTVRSVLQAFSQSIPSERQQSTSVLARLIAELHPSISMLLFELVCPSFLLFAYKGERPTTHEDEVLKELGLLNEFIKISGASKITYLPSSDTSNAVKVGKFPRLPSEREELEREITISRFFNDLHVNEVKLSCAHLYVEQYVRRRGHVSTSDANEHSLRWLANFQRKTAKGYWSPESICHRIADAAGRVPGLALDDDSRASLKSVLIEFSDEIATERIPINAEHGDFFSGNIVIQPDGRVYVFDWEFYQEIGDPFMDCICYLESALNQRDFANLSDMTKEDIQSTTMIGGRLLRLFAQTRNLDPRIVRASIPYVLLRCALRDQHSETRRPRTDHYLSLLRCTH